jgi:shikimate kinase
VTAEDIVALLDPRLRGPLAEELARRRAAPPPPLALGRRVILVGHRGAGKSTLLGPVAELLGWPAVDLDAEVERRLGKPARRVFAEEGPDRFRAAEREAYQALPVRRVVAVGGGFLSLHADLLERDTAVLVPVTFETYRERLLADTERPRLYPEMAVEDELRYTFRSREELHRRAPTVPVVDFLLGVSGGTR